ncbi:MAG: flavin reductase family protein [Mycobacteriales bacterium]
MPEGTAADEGFNALVAELDYPMFIVTVTDGTRRAGCLIGFAAQCSIGPVRFMAWLSKNNYTHSVARHADVLAVHLPTAGDRAIVALFGTETGFETDKFARCSWQEGPGGVPLLDGCPQWFAGRILERHDTGDHVGYLLEPIAAGRTSGRPQLGFQSVRSLDAGNDA